MMQLLKQILCIKINTTLGAIAGWALTYWMIFEKPWLHTATVFTKGGIKAVIGSWLGF